MNIAYFVNGVPIRLTEERWTHIVENKPYMSAYYDKILAAVENPTLILRGYAGALVAVLLVGRRRFLNVVYREISRNDGFIITAFVSLKVSKGNVIWPKRNPRKKEPDPSAQGSVPSGATTTNSYAVGLR